MLTQKKIVIYSCCAAVLLIGGSMVGLPHYTVWQQQMAGRAKLAEAVHSRQIKIEEAKAAKESAELLADAKLSRAKGEAAAEVARAKGVAEEIEVIGTKLRDYPGYTNYRWVEGLNDGNSEVIYVATEGGRPVLTRSTN